MKSSSRNLGIGDAAAVFGLATHVLRHWESLGLVTPARDSAGRRRYHDDDIFRIAVILCAKEAGLGLDAIAEMITATALNTRREILHRHRDQLAATITAAQTALAIVDGALRCEHDDFTTCPHFRATVADRISITPVRHIPAR
ncbi:hypothetical protein A5780_30485 [Nocardia sp. 852002-20019_SCH5090214]|nr:MULTISPECIES: MerR family transcriptional regulator [Nocardia]MCC3316731.1 MerR family transcriptional regulator [Nocardia africana]MCC3318381.1 MerR family transcriptional regulator [Nocardia africana]OBA50932.1 hypothetical protein A5780_30485 [Nocardia sp. 852002-20019_SCH5090214]